MRQRKRSICRFTFHMSAMARAGARPKAGVWNSLCIFHLGGRGSSTEHLGYRGAGLKVKQSLLKTVTDLGG